MKADISQDIRFESAHFLPRMREGHKCRRLHGHSYRATVTVSGEVDPETGFVIDFYEVEEAVRPLREQLDHRLLNEVPGLENPTAELIARFIFDRLRPSLPGLTEVVVHETCESRATYRGH